MAKNTKKMKAVMKISLAWLKASVISVSNGLYEISMKMQRNQ
jgi:hypothetical protein